jgi:hypothetical protein
MKVPDVEPSSSTDPAFGPRGRSNAVFQVVDIQEARRKVEEKEATKEGQRSSDTADRTPTSVGFATSPSVARVFPNFEARG